MKYRIVTNQEAIINNGYDLDFADAAILDVIYHLNGSTFTKKLNDNGRVYFWLSTKLILKEAPMLRTKVTNKETGEKEYKPFSTGTIKNKLMHLSKLGFIEQHPNNKEMGTRFICITSMLESLYSSTDPQNDTRNNKMTGVITELQAPSLQNDTPVITECTYNNTNNNNTNNNKEELSDFEKSNDVAGTSKDDILYNQFLEIFEYFKRVTGKKLKLRSTKSLVKRSDKYKYITKRLKEKFTVEDAKKVIDCKHAEWCDNPKMQKHITIQTIFSTKFEKYLDDAENTPNLSDNTQGGINTPKSKENAIAFKLEGNELEAYKFLQQKVNDERFTPLVYSKCFNVQKLRRYTQHITRTDIAMRIKRGIIEWTKAYNKNELLSDIIMQEFSKR